MWGTCRTVLVQTHVADLMIKVFLRSLTLHLHVCWQLVTGQRFVIVSQLVGWGVPIIIVSESLAFTGVSYRFGNVCHVNHQNSLGDFWIPALVFTGSAALVQFAT